MTLCARNFDFYYRCNLAPQRWRREPYHHVHNSRQARPDESDAVYPIRLWGLDACGSPFIEAATTLDVSGGGALLKHVPVKLAAGDIIGLSSGEKKCRFRVVWIGRKGTPEAGHLGLRSLEPEKHIWDLHLPEPSAIFTLGRMKLNIACPHDCNVPCPPRLELLIRLGARGRSSPTSASDVYTLRCPLL